MLDFSQTEPRLRPANEIPRDARRAIASIKTKRYTEGRGESAREVEVSEFKACDKLLAIEKICKILGISETDEVEELRKQIAEVREMFAAEKKSEPQS